MMEVGAPIVLMGVASTQIVGASVSYLSCTTKSRNCQAVMEEIDKGCSEF